MDIFANRDPTLRDMSVDFKLFFSYHIAMMVMFAAGQSGISVRTELLITAMIASVLVAAAVRHRKKCGWRWPGVKPSDMLGAAVGVAFVIFFLFAATPLFPPTTGKSLPWYLAGLGIGSFGVLTSLRLAYGSETEFLKQCHVLHPSGREIIRVQEIPEPNAPLEPVWNKRIRIAYVIVFMLVWAAGVLSFYTFGQAFKNGAQAPASSHTEPLTNHGKTVYITSGEKRRIDGLHNVMWVGIPSLIVTGLVLHFIVGVKIFNQQQLRRGT